MTFRLHIDIGNDAMTRWGDVADALRRVVEKIDSGTVQGLRTRVISCNSVCPTYCENIWAANGNIVGQWYAKQEER